MRLTSNQFTCISDEDAEMYVGRTIEFKFSQSKESQTGIITRLLSFDFSTIPSAYQYKQTKYLGFLIDEKFKLYFNADIDYIIVKE